MSSNDVAISVRDLSKSYTIVHGQQRRPTFRDLVMDRLRNPFKRDQKETFWALKDVSFDIKKGEVVGIIGRNGAGKSTLLKILSRITEPTDGEIDLYGRVGSLLEVGTGFKQASDATIQIDFAVGWLCDSAEDFQQRALARAVAADDPDHLALLDVKRNILKRP